jgi:hypothetical protein
MDSKSTLKTKHNDQIMVKQENTQRRSIIIVYETCTTDSDCNVILFSFYA